MIISRENDVIYELLFSVELQNPVTLNITYTNERGQSESRIPDVGYNNTRTIAYREIVGQLPYEVYHVSIALIGVNGSQRIMGPPTVRDEIVGMYSTCNHFWGNDATIINTLNFFFRSKKET